MILYFQEKKHRIGENRCLQCFSPPCLINIGRSSKEHLFRAGPHPSGHSLTPALTICCFSYAVTLHSSFLFWWTFVEENAMQEHLLRFCISI